GFDLLSGEANVLRDKLRTRQDELAAHVQQIEAYTAETVEEMRAHDSEVEAARQALIAAEQAQERARELRTKAQIEEAQIQARVQVAADRERRLADEAGSATQRLEVLRTEL